MQTKRNGKLSLKDREMARRIGAAKNKERIERSKREHKINMGLLAQDALVLNGNVEEYDLNCFD